MTQPATPELVCSSCRLPKASLKKGLQCGVCKVLLCKDCAYFPEDGAFSFFKTIPEDLRHAVYCGACHQEKVSPALEAYSETIERSKDVSIFYKQDKYIPLIRKGKFQINVKGCKDKKETLLRMAFFAVEEGYNAVIEVDLVATKIKINGYQTHHWSGSGFPADVTDHER